MQGFVGSCPGLDISYLQTSANHCTARQFAIYKKTKLKKNGENDFLNTSQAVTLLGGKD